jgi:hypothetical protein
MGYRKVASESQRGTTAATEGEAQPADDIREKRQLKSRPEVRLAAEIAGVGYSMAYKVLRGKSQSEKVELALTLARERIRQQRAEARKAAREQLRQLKATQKKLQRVLARRRAA